MNESTANTIKSSDELFALPGYDPVMVPLTGTDRVVFVRIINGRERDEVDAFFIASNRDTRGLRAKVVMYAACDENGDRLFGDDDFDRVSSLPSPVLTELFDAAADLNGLTDESAGKLEGN